MKPLIDPINTSDGQFHPINTQTGEKATIVTPAYMNDSQDATRSLQRELISILTASGIKPAEATDNQLLTALKALFLNEDDDRVSGALQKGKNLADVTDASASLKNLGGFPMTGGTLSENASFTAISGDTAPNVGDVLYAPGFRSCIKGRGAQDFPDGASLLLRIIEQVGSESWAELLFTGFGASQAFQFKQNGEFKAPSTVHAADAFMATDGNIYGSCWGGYLSDWINSQISGKTGADLGSGWWKDNNTGLIMQYGVATKDGGSYVGGATFPISFPSACRSITANPAISVAADSSTSNIQIHDVTTTGFSYTTGTVEAAIYWMAMGY